VLPSWLQLVAQFIPVTYALDALRGALIPGADSLDVGYNAFALALFALGLLPAAFVAAHLVFEKARERGNLGSY
jgi:ABC-2 type transport system permease protein